MGIDIIKILGTNCTSYYANRPHKWIAIHYTAGTTSRNGAARNTAYYFKNYATGGSADYIVDDKEIVRYNADLNNRRCWAVGDNSRAYSKGGSLYGVALNCNTVSIEICSSSVGGQVYQANSPNWYFTDAAVENALKLTRYLMDLYGIDIDHVVRHYDISGKYCPGIIGWNGNTGDESKWLNFKARLRAMTNKESEEDVMTYEQYTAFRERYDKEIAAKAASSWAADYAKNAIVSGLFNDGDGDGSLDNPQAPVTREQLAAVLDRAGMFAAQDQFITHFNELPEWAKAPMREILDKQFVDGGTDYKNDPDDINMYMSQIKTLIVTKRMIDAKK